MKKFEFKSKVEPIELCGKEYTLDTGNVEWLKKALSKGDDIQLKLAEIVNAKFSAKKIDDLVELLTEALDLFLGEGEFERIYDHEDCKRNVHYLTAICSFLMEEIKNQAGKNV